MRNTCFIEQVCVLIASWPQYFAPCLLKAVVTLRESKKAALVSAGLAGGLRGSQLVPKHSGLCWDLVAYLASWGLQLSLWAGRQLLLPCRAAAAASRKTFEPGMRKDAGICVCSQPFISEMQPSQATGQKAKRPGKGSGSIRE